MTPEARAILILLMASANLFVIPWTDGSKIASWTCCLSAKYPVAMRLNHGYMTISPTDEFVGTAWSRLRLPLLKLYSISNIVVVQFAMKPIQPVGSATISGSDRKGL